MGTGNTKRPASTTKSLAVHPRGYGEHFFSAYICSCAFGSSPWVRGTPYPSRCWYQYSRFIPVGTGNTCLSTSSASHPPVHPRGYGEHHIQKTVIGFLFGSSPWVRGTHGLSRYFPSNEAVHPRGYGEHDNTIIIKRYLNGSSPWVRGTHISPSALGILYRFIPVGTGNTG